MLLILIFLVAEKRGVRATDITDEQDWKCQVTQDTSAPRFCKAGHHKHLKPPVFPYTEFWFWGAALDLKAFGNQKGFSDFSF